MSEKTAVKKTMEKKTVAKKTVAKKIKAKKLKLKNIKNCEALKDDYNKGDLKKNIANQNYQQLLRCIGEEDAQLLKERPDDFPYLYPNKDDDMFNVKIAQKKEFFDAKYEPHTKEEYDNIIDYTQILCDEKEFELDPHQMFVRNFMSFQTPYNGLLLFHGLGTGKTCSAISVCEETRTYLQQMGISKRIIIVASPAVQENFKLQLFDERKLKNINGLWNIKACIGNKFIKEINPMNMKGLSKNKVVSQIKKLIKQSYLFKGYTEFSNYIIRIMDKRVTTNDSEEIKKKKQRQNLRTEFSNRMLVIDEVHNIRLSKEGKVKASSDNLEKLVMATHNLKILLLSATPMFDSYSEIIWILNILNLNDKRYPIEENEIFAKDGTFKLSNDGQEIGKQLLVRKATGYISYVRGENPFTFPYRIWPHEARNPDSLFTLMNDKIWQYPKYQINGGEIIRTPVLIDLTMCNIGSYQSIGYNKLIDFLKKKHSILNKPSAGMPYTILEAPLQALNMIYPHEGLEDADPNEDVLNYIYGSKGLARVMYFKPKTKREFVYKDKIMKKFGRIFSPSEIGKYSSKIAYMCDKIKNSEGIIFIYSQYIDGGAVPIALALEEMGITRYGTVSSLFKTPPTQPLNVLTMKQRESDKPFKAAKYIMITGQKSLTPDVKREIQAVTDKNNVNGEKVKVIIVSRAGSEGLDFQNIRQLHILDPWYNINREEQIIGRAVRGKSHCRLPYIKRNVELNLYATRLENKEVEAIDLYVYRHAEKKALQIARVTHIIKETAVDCLLNRKGLDFSEKSIAELTSNNVVEQHLSSGIVIDYTLGDKKDSIICDFKDCEYKCKPDIDLDGDDINKDTYNETFIIMNLDKILQRIRNLFQEKYIYKKQELLMNIAMIKNYPIDQIYTALSYLINDKNEFITDALGRLGNLVNIGDYYMFQPVELTNNQISRYDRVTPIPFKRQGIKFILSELPEHRASGFQEIIQKLQTTNKLLRIPQEITSHNKNNWSMICAWAISNLVKYNSDKFNLSEEEFLKLLITLAMHHIIDILSYDEKILLLQNMSEIGDDVLQYVESYFEKFKIYTKKYQGLIITDFNKKSNYTILTLKDDLWTNDKLAIAGGLGKVALDKFTVSVDNINDQIGFMAQVKKYDLIFKVKSMTRSVANRPSKGSSCEKGSDKKILISNINDILKFNDIDIKYIMGAKTGSGARTITQIYDKKGIDIAQYPYKKNDKGEFIKNAAGNYKIDKRKTVRINAFQLCIEQELLFRYFNKYSKNGKRWFFSSVESIINNIEKVSK